MSIQELAADDRVDAAVGRQLALDAMVTGGLQALCMRSRVVKFHGTVRKDSQEGSPRNPISRR